MSIISFVVVFLMIWMIFFFISLPIGIKVKDKIDNGFANSAPENPNLKIKFFLSFLIAFVTSMFFYWIIESGLLQLFIS